MVKLTLRLLLQGFVKIPLVPHQNMAIAMAVIQTAASEGHGAPKRNYPLT